MKRLALCSLAALAAAACLRSRPAPDEKIERTFERVARGEYLANAVFACIDCHSTPDEAVYSRPPKAGTTPGAGGQCWDAATGFPGRLCAPNLTSDDETGLGRWTDGELMRAIREGVDRHGNGLFPVMPYRDYAFLSDEDTRAIVAYLRTLAPVKHAVPKKELDFPVGLFIRFAPRPLEGPVPEPDRADAIAYGRYLGRPCLRCHTPSDSRGRMLAGRELAGGQELKLPSGGVVVSPSLRPEPNTPGSWPKEQFLARFRNVEAAPVEPAKNTVMPWLSLSRLTDEDLSALWDWLHAPAPPAP